MKGQWLFVLCLVPIFLILGFADEAVSSGEDIGDMQIELEEILREIEEQTGESAVLFHMHGGPGSDKQYEGYRLTINVCQFFNIVRFLLVDENHDWCSDIISPNIPGWHYEPSRCVDEWSQLAYKVEPGYYAAKHEEDKGEKNMHSFFFIKWLRDQSPADDPCKATFHGIGGNQGDGGRVTVKEFEIYNGEEDSECHIPDDPDETEMVWGSNYNFFGMIKEKP